MGNIFTYEGNTTDAYGNEGVVAYKSHPINDVQIVGYARPNYSV